MFGVTLLWCCFSHLAAVEILEAKVSESETKGRTLQKKLLVAGELHKRTEGELAEANALIAQLQDTISEQALRIGLLETQLAAAKSTSCSLTDALESTKVTILANRQ